jgi:hypothetical protein
MSLYDLADVHVLTFDPNTKRNFLAGAEGVSLIRVNRSTAAEGARWQGVFEQRAHHSEAITAQLRGAVQFSWVGAVQYHQLRQK